MLGYLAERGVPKDQLERVRVPAGLDLGSTTHPEIAVAILAELVQLRAAGALTSGGSAWSVSAVHPVSAVGERSERSASGAASARETRAQATDPVCGMTVTAGPDSMPVEYDGVTYYFCCAGCRQAFEHEPAAYVKRLLT